MTLPNIGKIYQGNTEIIKAYIGSTIVYQLAETGLYLEGTLSGSPFKQEFETTADMKSFISTNRANLTGHLKAVRGKDISEVEGESAETFAMFAECGSLTSLDVTNFNTSNVTNMGSMFQNCSSLTSLDLSSFDTSNVTSMLGLFSGCSSLVSLDLSSFDTTNATSTTMMFKGCTSVTESYGRTQTDCDKLNASSSKPSNVFFVVKPSLYLEGTLSGSPFREDFTTTADMKSFISTNRANLTGHLKAVRGKDISEAEGAISMQYMFQGCSNLTSLDVTNFNTSNVTNMTQMFQGCYNLTSLDVTNFNTYYVTNMVAMFQGCSNLTSLDVTNFNTSNVTNMTQMFQSCSNLTSLDVTNFNTSYATNMVAMFNNCTSLTSLDLSNFNTANVTSMTGMFNGCTSLTTLDLSSWDTQSTSYFNMGYMFDGCTSVTESYGRTQTDCDKFNSSSGKPSNVNFVVKP